MTSPRHFLDLHELPADELRLIREGLGPREAARAAVAGPLTDDPVVTRGLVEIIDTYLPAGD